MCKPLKAAGVPCLVPPKVAALAKQLQLLQPFVFLLLVVDELKTPLQANSTVLRSRTPDLVQQEFGGLLLAHFAVRQLLAQATWPRSLDPDRLSFANAIRVIKQKSPQAAATPP